MFLITVCDASVMVLLMLVTIYILYACGVDDDSLVGMVKAVMMVIKIMVAVISVGEWCWWLFLVTSKGIDDEVGDERDGCVLIIIHATAIWWRR